MNARELAEFEIDRDLRDFPIEAAHVIAVRAQALATLALADAVDNLTEQYVNEQNRKQS